MASNLAALFGAQAAGDTNLQVILDKIVPGFSFVPAFMRAWLQIDISHIIGLLSLIGAMSGGVDFINRVTVKLYWMLTRFCTASVSIAANDRLNREVLNWLAATVLRRQATRVLAARTEAVDDERIYFSRTKTTRDDYTQEKRRSVEYFPTFGATWFWHRSRIFIVRRVGASSRRSYFRGGDTPDEYADAPAGDEPLVVMCLGRSVAPIKRFLDDCRDWGEKQRESFVTIRICKHHYGSPSWDATILRPTRPIHTVHFDEKLKLELVRDIQNYLDPQTRTFYHQRGIPYRRGYLLHGPPGTGKTSLSLALAGIFGLELYLLHVPSIGGDKEIENLFSELPPRCILLLEDIDAVGLRRRKKNEDDSDGELNDDVDDDDNDDDDDDDDDDGSEKAYVTASKRSTLSGLLNVIDGVSSQEGRIVLMTSNHAEKLDPALVRPGRIDRKIYLGNISQESARLMFLRMYSGISPDHAMLAPFLKPGTVDGAAAATPNGAAGPPDKEGPPAHADEDEGLGKLAAEFAGHIPPGTLSPALIQGYLLSHRSEPAAARDGVQEFVADEVAKIEKDRKAAQRQREIKKRKRKEKAMKELAKSLAEAAGAAKKEVEEVKEKDKEDKKDVEAKETKEQEKRDEDCSPEKKEKSSAAEETATKDQTQTESVDAEVRVAADSTAE